MKKTIVTTLLSVALFTAAKSKDLYMGSVKMVLPDSATAARELNQTDKYTASLNPFDLKVRLNSNEALTEKNYLSFAAKQTQNWTPAEEQLLSKILDSINHYFVASKINLQLPKQIELIKTKGGEEFGAEGYTRENRIMLNPTAAKLNVHLVAHELFHIYSRYNEKKRDKIYRVFGFRKCNRIDYAAAFGGLVITNPDCPVVEHYTTLSQHAAHKKMALILYSRSDYQPGLKLSDYFDVQLTELEGGGKLKPHIVNGKPVLYDLDASETLKKILQNTQYAIHPEEIAAEHFALMIEGKKLREPVYADFMKGILQD